jgi:putative transposase
VDVDVRDGVVEYAQVMHQKAAIPMERLIGWIGITRSKYYQWGGRMGRANAHNGRIVKKHWVLPWEREAIMGYARKHLEEGYRRMTYMMLDEDVVAVSPSTTYRVLKGAGLLQRWNTGKARRKGHGFEQPTRPHEHWHTDIKYVNYHGSFLFLIGVFDGYSRGMVHHELRMSMTEHDVQVTLERAHEKYPNERPRIISDNGPQFISRDFAEFLRLKGLQHVRTSIAYPQGNGKIERFHGTISVECLRKRSFLDLEDARRQIDEYVEYYNKHRLHSALYYLTPDDFMNGRVEGRLRGREEKLQQARQNRIQASADLQLKSCA